MTYLPGLLPSNQCLRRLLQYLHRAYFGLIPYRLVSLAARLAGRHQQVEEKREGEDGRREWEGVWGI